MNQSDRGKIGGFSANMVMPDSDSNSTHSMESAPSATFGNGLVMLDSDVEMHASETEHSVYLGNSLITPDTQVILVDATAPLRGHRVHFASESSLVMPESDSDSDVNICAPNELIMQDSDTVLVPDVQFHEIENMSGSEFTYFSIWLKLIIWNLPDSHTDFNAEDYLGNVVGPVDVWGSTNAA